MPGDQRLRIVVTVKGDAHPELYRDLATMPREARSERMRTLAMLGALAGHGKVGLSTGAATGADAAGPDRPVPGDVDGATVGAIGGSGWDS